MHGLMGGIQNRHRLNILLNITASNVMECECAAVADLREPKEAMPAVGAWLRARAIFAQFAMVSWGASGGAKPINLNEAIDPAFSNLSSC